MPHARLHRLPEGGQRVGLLSVGRRQVVAKHLAARIEGVRIEDQGAVAAIDAGAAPGRLDQAAQDRSGTLRVDGEAEAVVGAAARWSRLALQELFRIELDLVGVDAGGRCERSGDDLALREQALHFGVDQAGAELIEVENAGNEDREADQIEDDDAAREAGEAMAEGQALPQPAHPPAQADVACFQAAAQALSEPRRLGFLPGPIGLGGHGSPDPLLFEAIPHTVEGFDHVEARIYGFELLAQALDVAVDRSIVDIDLVIIGGIHQRVAAFHHAWPRGKRLQDQKLGDGQRHRAVVPHASVPLRVHLELAALEHLGLVLDRRGAVARLGPAQHGLDPLDQKALRKGFADEVVGAHLEAEQLVDLLVLRGEENDGKLGALAEPPQQLHAVHARHLDVEDGKVRRIFRKAVKGACAVVIGLGFVAFRLEHHAQGGQNVTIVVDKCDGWH